MPDMKKLRRWVKAGLDELRGPQFDEKKGISIPMPRRPVDQLDPPKVAKAVPSQWVKDQDAKMRQKKKQKPMSMGRTDVVAAARLY